MKTNLPEAISTVDEAKAYLTELYKNNESYHPEDSARGCFPADYLSNDDSDRMDKLMQDIYNLPGNDGRHTNLLFDPCEFILNLDPDHMRTSRKSAFLDAYNNIKAFISSTAEESILNDLDRLWYIYLEAERFPRISPEEGHASTYE